MIGPQKISKPNEKYLLLIFFVLFFTFFSAQNIVWSEDFQTYPDGTQNASKWTSTANNCDADGAPGIVGNNFWGVRTTLGDKEFCCEDLEGITCCINSQGQNDNEWLSEVINISGYINLSVSISIRTEGTMECGSCGSGRDNLKAEYQINGGLWTTFVDQCGPANGFTLYSCTDIGTGNTLRIRVLLGNQADDEEWYFDDIVVYAQPCAIVLPIQLIEFAASENNSFINISWATAAEFNNAYFTVERSANGLNWEELKIVNSHGNSSTVQHYETKDEKPISGISYYRLKQTDFNGSYSYSGIVLIDREKTSKKIIKVVDIFGRETDENTGGLILKVYEDGSTEKIFRVNQ
jgi:hypothetical protein